MQVQSFYNGYTQITWKMLDVAVGGTLGNKKPDEVMELFVVIAMNGY